ncbi:hypothetical protein NFI96_025960 [Prochilodus magdalenae]|nr:hypothetical protein NFI96_025960 [Prochilodus magdalenae]
MELWKIVTAVLGVAAVVTVIAVPTAIYLNEKDDGGSQRTFTLSDYFNGSMRPRSFNLRWLSDSEYLHKAPDGAVLLFNVSSESGQEFLERQLFDRVEASDYMVSADRKFVCFLSNYTKLWRHSYLASYSIYDRENGDFVSTDIPHEVQYLAWSPTGHKLAYVWMYNVYVKASPTAPSQQVTFNGVPNQVLNGIPDWVYEEEMFSTNYALWWSPTGKYLAFAQFNDTNVHTIEYSWYGDTQYPETVFIPYPKSCVVQPSADGAALTGGLMEDTTARWRSVVVVLGQSGTEIRPVLDYLTCAASAVAGQYASIPGCFRRNPFIRSGVGVRSGPVRVRFSNRGVYYRHVLSPPGTPNPTVRLFVVDAADVDRVMEVVVPGALGAGDHYLCTVTWATDERIAVQWQNRTQNFVTLQLYELTGNTWGATTGVNVVSKTGWVGQFSPSEPVFRPDGSSCYYIRSDSSGFKHLHHITGVTKDAVTPVEICLCLCPCRFYVSNQHSHPGQRNVYRISVDGSTHSPAVCLTCTVNEERCKYNSASFSADGTYYRMDCSGPGFPMYTLRDSRGAGSEIKVFESNTNLQSILQNIAMPSVQHGTLKIGEFELWYQMTLPPNFDKSKKYPLLIDVYAGPCSQKSDFRFRINWSTYLASTENIIVASFDGRGSGYQGDKIMHSIYKRLGTYEVEDQITAARHFIDLGYVDKERIAIWGWTLQCEANLRLHAHHKQRLGARARQRVLQPSESWNKYFFIIVMKDRRGAALEPPLVEICSCTLSWTPHPAQRDAPGKSYGGYVASMVLGAGSGVFKCGMAVAPVSKWEYYDTIYTERYMLTPAENQAFYDSSTVMGRAKNFKTVQYLLVHGTADDNVHFQQAAQISKALVDEQVEFDSMWYTDEDHGLGGSANQHVYTHLSHFLKNCFA